MIGISFGVTFYLRSNAGQFAYRRMYSVPRVGDVCVFNNVRYLVERVEWCLDVDSTAAGTKINVELRGERS